MVDGGVAIATGRLAEHLLHHGHQVTVLTTPSTIATPPASVAPWMQSASLRVAYRAVEDPLRNPDAVTEVGTWLRRHHEQMPFDVLLAYFVYPSGYLATLLGADLNVPVVCSCRGNDITKDMFTDPASIAVVLERSDHLIFVSSSLLQMADTLVPCRQKSTVVANSVDCRQFAPVSRPEASQQTVVIGTSGLMRWKKGIDVFLPLCRELCTRRNVGIHLAGYGLDEAIDQQMEQFVEQHGLRQRLRILGPLPHEYMPRYLNDMDIYCSTSYQEGMPNGVLEAMASALPVVATAADGIPQLVEHGVTGYLCPVGDLESLVTSCLKLIDEPELRRRMGHAGRRRVQEHFQPRRETAEIEAVLHAVCETD